MADIDVKIQNIDAIRAAFKSSPLRMAQNLDIAIKKSIFAIERVSQMNTPVLTGFLRASHTTTFQPLRGEVGPTASYATFVHDGTRFMRARPFLADAVKEEDNDIQKYFQTAVQDTLDTIAKDSNHGL